MSLDYPYPESVKGQPDCRRCEHEALLPLRDSDPIAYLSRRFVVCPACGSKRCPRADDHRLACREA